MPNLCDYTMKIVGEKEKIATLIKYLQNDYWYVEDENSYRPTEEQIRKYSHCYEEDNWKLYTNAEKHFYRVFSACPDEKDGEIIYQKSSDGRWETYVCGDCAWSVAACMMDSFLSYYSQSRNEPLREHGTTLEIESKELDLDVEVVSAEPGCCFSEHYLYKNGELLADECFDYQEYCLDDFETKEEAEKENGISITDDEWEKKGYISRGEINPYDPEWSI